MEAIQSEFEIDVQYRHFPLHPDTPPDGLTLEQLFAGRGIDVAAAQERMARLMADEGLAYGERTHTYNSRLAQELASWAVEQPGGEAIHGTLFQAYFVEGLNLGEPDVLIAAARRVPLPPEEAQHILETRSYRDRVDADWQRSWTLGLSGVPAFVLGSRGLVGAQPLETLRDFLVSSGIAPRER